MNRGFQNAAAFVILQVKSDFTEFHGAAIGIGDR